jgi:hypothetical protein
MLWIIRDPEKTAGIFPGFPGQLFFVLIQALGDGTGDVAQKPGFVPPAPSFAS